MIAIRETLGVRRQVFFVGMGGFDTHGDQNRRQPELLQELSDGLQAFDLASKQTERAAEMLEELKARLEAQRASAPEHRVGAGARTEQNLGGLGYGGDRHEDS